MPFWIPLNIHPNCPSVFPNLTDTICEQCLMAGIPYLENISRKIAFLYSRCFFRNNCPQKSVTTFVQRIDFTNKIFQTRKVLRKEYVEDIFRVNNWEGRMKDSSEWMENSTLLRKPAPVLYLCHSSLLQSNSMESSQIYLYDTYYYLNLWSNTYIP